jgi:hypothetical protein
VNSSDACGYYVEVGSTEEDEGTCAECPVVLFNNDNGKCVLKSCSARIRNESASYVCGSVNCVFNGTNCNEECPPNMAADNRGICGDPILACSQKIPLPGDVRRCGIGCFFIADEMRCSNECPQFYVTNINTGGCDILPCSGRTPNSTLSFDYCGSGCFREGFAKCSDRCMSGKYDPLTKVCEVDVNCSEVQYIPTALKKCGDYCVYDIETSMCAQSCSAFYSVNTESGVCSAISCETRTPNETWKLSCGPFPCFLSGGSCLLNCPAGQAPNSVGICETAFLTSPVNANMVTSLNDAIHYKLDKSVNSPVVLVDSMTNLDGVAEIGGVSIEGIPSISSIMVIAPSTLSITYNEQLNKPTTISLVKFDITLTLITSPLINGTSSNSLLSSVSLNQVFFSYRTTLGVPLIVLSDINNVQFNNISIILEKISLMNGEFSDICQVQTNSAALDLNNVKATITSSLFQNINTGL